MKSYHMIHKLGCVFPMVIWPEFRMGRYRDDDHREDAPHFRTDYHWLCLIITYIANSISHHENNNINQNEIVRFFNVNSPCSKHITEYNELLTCDIYADKRTSARVNFGTN